ncbi:MAG: extracellular solute-binding protein [Spirochaetales bacterium]|nr:extracellular solute-binding protein [Spirochaetales bacterium]
MKILKQVFPALVLLGILSSPTYAAGTQEKGNGHEPDEAIIMVNLTNAALENDVMAIQRQKWLLENYRRVEPDTVVNYNPYRYDPQTFVARFAGDQLEDSYAVFFTEPQGLIADGYAADISEYVADLPYLSEFNAEILKVAKDENGGIYGLPHDAYGLGLMYNRELFAQAGLDPDQPPQTWEEVREYAKIISDKLPGVDGFNIRNEGGLGGWMLTTLMYTFGGDAMVEKEGRWSASYNNPGMVKALQLLHDMLFIDKTTTPDITGWGNFPQVLDFAAGKVAMTIAAGDTLKWMVGNMEDFDFKVAGFGRMPDGGANATLGGGNVWLYNPKSAPEALEAAVKYNVWRDFDILSFENDIKAQAERGDLIGFPQVNIFTGEMGRQRDEIIKKYANAPVENYKNFNEADIIIRGEPPMEAQALYTELGLVYQTVMSQDTPDIPSILDKSVEKFQSQVLDQIQQ